MEGRFRGNKSDNATIWGWSKRLQMETGDSLKNGHMSEVVGYTPIVSKQNNLHELKEIWRRWDFRMKQDFQQEYGDIAMLLDVQTDMYLFRALTQFWNPEYNCFTFETVDFNPTIEEYMALIRCSKNKDGKVYTKPKDASSFVKNLTDINGMSSV